MNMESTKFISVNILKEFIAVKNMDVHTKERVPYKFKVLYISYLNFMGTIHGSWTLMYPLHYVTLFSFLNFF